MKNKFSAVSHSFEKRAISLPEVLLALLIASILMTTIYSTYTNSINIIKESQTRALEERKKNILFNIIQKDIQNSFYTKEPKKRYFRTIQQDRGDQAVDSLDLVTLNSGLSRYAASSELREVGYFLKESGKTEMGEQYYNLLRREQIGIDENPDQGGDVSILATNVYSFKVETMATLGVYKWSRVWDYQEQKRYPAGVMVTISFIRRGSVENLQTMKILGSVRQERPS